MSGRFEELVNQLLGGLETTTGQEFLERFVALIAALFGADSAAIALLDAANDSRLRTLAFSTAGELIESEYWPLASSPNEEVIDRRSACICRSRAGERFPADEVVRRTDTDCYIGVPLIDSDGGAIGVLTLMHHQAIAQDELAADVMQLFADRIVAEIERLENDASYDRIRQSLESQLRGCSDDLEITRQQLESLAHGVSHDLRGPLRAINGFSEMLLSDYSDRLDQNAAGYLHRIRSNARQMDVLLQALLLLSRVTRQPLRCIPISLSNLCDRSLGRLRRQDPHRRVEASIESGVHACCDPDMMAIALDQLLDNAWKFSAHRDPAQIEFSVEARGGDAVYRIADNGIGFDMAYIDKAFELFQRLHGPQDFPGVGAGLTTVKRIVERHGGSIWVEAQNGRGASFFFTLPQPPNCAATPQPVSGPA